MSGSTRRAIPPLVDDPRAVGLTLAQRHTLALLPLALDDHGRTLDDPGRINGLLWGSLWRGHTPDDLAADVAALAGAGLVTRYEVEGVGYLQMLDWDAQQVISRRSPSRYPAPPTGTRSTPPGGQRAAGGGFGGSFGRGWGGGGFSAPTMPDAVWESVDAVVDAVTGATEKLHDPAVQSRAVSFLADMAGQVDPDLAAKIRERAAEWLGSVAYGEPGRTSAWSQATQDDVVRLKVVKDDDAETTEQAGQSEPAGPVPSESAQADANEPAEAAEAAEANGAGREEESGSTPQDTP